MNDRDFLIWIHERLEHVHGESPIVDYMHKLRAIIKATPANQRTPNMATGNKLADILPALANDQAQRPERNNTKTDMNPNDTTANARVVRPPTIDDRMSGEAHAKRLKVWCKNELPKIRNCGETTRARITQSLTAAGLLADCKHEQAYLVQSASGNESWYECAHCGDVVA